MYLHSLNVTDHQKHLKAVEKAFVQHKQFEGLQEALLHKASMTQQLQKARAIIVNLYKGDMAHKSNWRQGSSN